ncbi:MAG: TolC family protein [Prevotella sp.]|nr:TolC family protein [Prevotella sp.]
MKSFIVCCGTAAALLAPAAALPAAAQEPWSLERCIDNAVAHNITIEQYRLRTESQAIQLQNAKYSRLPDLNASAGENFSFGRGLTADNTYTNTNTSSTSFSVGTSVPIFTGFQIPNQIKLNQLNLEAATADLEKAKNDIRTQVAQEYVQALYNMEILDVARRQVSIDSAQVARLQALLDVGRASRAELSQQQATLAQSRLTVTQADNNLKLALLSLSQLLELDSPEGFTVLRPDSVEWKVESGEFATAVPSGEGMAAANSTPYTLNSTLENALSTKPEVQAAQLRLQAADRSIKIAQAGLYPTLSFSAGLGTNYYTTSGFKADGFGTQLKNNFSQYLGFNLSIPIFNRFQTRNSIRSAKLEKMNQTLALAQTKRTLYKEIQTAWYNTIAAREKLHSSNEARRASEDAFQLVQAKYEQGKATITEFNEAKNAYLKTESDLTQARYEYLYQTALLKFYRGEPLHF